VTSGKLRVLFVGGLSQRKGLSYLLQAVESLGSTVELTLIGRTVAPCPPLEAALNRHRWLPSLPNQAVLGEMQRHDVLVFPSLFEGFGLVIIEALAQGLPVITTNHTAGPDLLTEGKDGFIVSIRNAEAIAEKLLWLTQNREALFQMSQHAQQTAQRFSWQAYGEKLCNVLL
jgi:glycosyltransferase involved in cell wall biosynthesis